MAVYVDEIHDYTRLEILPKHLRRHWCHMTADTPEELHAMAQAIGLRRSWYQDQKPDPEFHHYDITPPKRAFAIRLGAIEVECTERACTILQLIRDRKER